MNAKVSKSNITGLQDLNMFVFLAGEKQVSLKSSKN